MSKRVCALVFMAHLLSFGCSNALPVNQSNPTLLDKKKECPHCSIEAVTIAQERVDTLSKEDFECFIATFDPSCSSNVEYSEFSNEVLFNVLLKHPVYLIQHVADNPATINTEYILKQLQAPVSDEVSVAQCVNAVSVAVGPSLAKEQILKSLGHL